MNESRNRIRRLAQYIQENPGDSFSKFALALELLKNNQVDKSLALYESIYRQDPDYLGIYYHLGKLYQSLNRYEDAEKCFGEGVDLADIRNEQQTLSELNEALELLREEKRHENV